MAIRSNIGLGVTAILAVDTPLIVPAAPLDRISIGAISLHNDGVAGATITVELYISPDLTSASGDRVGIYRIPDDAQVDAVALIGQGLAVGENLIAVGSVLGCNVHITETEYDGNS